MTSTDGGDRRSSRTRCQLVKLAKMLDELDIGQPNADCMPVDGVAFREKACDWKAGEGAFLASRR